MVLLYSGMRKEFFNHVLPFFCVNALAFFNHELVAITGGLEWLWSEGWEYLAPKRFNLLHAATFRCQALDFD